MITDSRGTVVLKNVQSAWNTVYASHLLNSPQIVIVFFKNKAEIHAISGSSRRINKLVLIFGLCWEKGLSSFPCFYTGKGGERGKSYFLPPMSQGQGISWLSKWGLLPHVVQCLCVLQLG